MQFSTMTFKDQTPGPATEKHTCSCGSWSQLLAMNLNSLSLQTWSGKGTFTCEEKQCSWVAPFQNYSSGYNHPSHLSQDFLPPPGSQSTLGPSLVSQPTSTPPQSASLPWSPLYCTFPLYVSHHEIQTCIKNFSSVKASEGLQPTCIKMYYGHIAVMTQTYIVFWSLAMLYA